jgi:type IV pilus assembly protein PilA
VVKKMMNTRFKLLKNQKGLTLVELLAVIVILGVVAAIAVPAIGGIINNSKVNADAQTEQMLKDAAVRYLTDVDPDGDGKDSTNTTVLILTSGAGTLNVSTLVTNNYLKATPKKQQLTTATWYNTVPVTFTAGTGWDEGTTALGTTTTTPTK